MEFNQLPTEIQQNIHGRIIQSLKPYFTKTSQQIENELYMRKDPISELERIYIVIKCMSQLNGIHPQLKDSADTLHCDK